MPRFNVFEGSRRVALLVKALWAVAVLAIAWSSKPYVSLKFVTLSPEDAFRRVADSQCDIGSDAIEWVDRPIGSGKTARVELCFKAHTFEDSDGQGNAKARQLVPYRMVGNTWWGNGPYSDDVKPYAEARARAFVLPESDRKVALEDWQRQSSKNLQQAVLIAIGGWIALSMFQALTGWIVRGFLGIPWGCDERPGPRRPGKKEPRSTAPIAASHAVNLTQPLGNEQKLPTSFYCARCEEFRAWDDLIDVRECPTCENRFDGTDLGPLCPLCRSEAPLLTQKGCRECFEPVDRSG